MRVLKTRSSAAVNLCNPGRPAFLNRIVALLPNPCLSPSEKAAAGISERYAVWETSLAAATFRQISTAGDQSRASEEECTRLWHTVLLEPETFSRDSALVLDLKRIVTEYADTLSCIWESQEAPFALPPRRDGLSLQRSFCGFRNLARLLALEAARRIALGDAEGALEACAVGVLFGSRVAQGSDLAGRLESTILQEIGRRFLWVALTRAARDHRPDALRNVKNDLEQVIAREIPFAETLLQEKSFGTAMLLDAWEGRAHGDLQLLLTMAGLLETIVLGKRFAFEAYGRFFDDWMTIADCSYCARPNRPQTPRVITDYVDGIVLGKVYHAVRVQRAQNALAVVALGLLLFYVERQRYPDSLDELMPGYLTLIPTDPFSLTNDAVRYRRDGTGYQLYSVGPDGKDDNGSPVWTPSASRENGSRLVQENSIGDIVAGVNF